MLCQILALEKLSFSGMYKKYACILCWILANGYFQPRNVAELLVYIAEKGRKDRE